MFVLDDGEPDYGELMATGFATRRGASDVRSPDARKGDATAVVRATVSFHNTAPTPAQLDATFMITAFCYGAVTEDRVGCGASDRAAVRPADNCVNEPERSAPQVPPRLLRE